MDCFLIIYYIYNVVVLHIDPIPDCITEVFFDNPETVVLRCISAGAHPWPDFKWFLQARNIKTCYRLKVRQNRNDFFKPTFPPKNERINSILLL